MAVNLDRDCKRTLSRAERDFYEENGYVIVPDVLPLEELNRLNQELHQLWTARAADPSRSAEDVNNIHGLGEISPQSEALATDERIIGLIEALVSPASRSFRRR